MTDLAQSTVSAADLRARLADALTAAGFVTTPSVEAAVRRVPREVFVPDGTDLAAAYANNIVVTKRGPDGKTTSSISAPGCRRTCWKPPGSGPDPVCWRSGPAVTTPR